MEDLKTAITAAKDADALQFKNSIVSALGDKVAQGLEVQKMELAGTIFGDESEEQTSEDDLDVEEMPVEEDDNEIPEEE